MVSTINSFLVHNKSNLNVIHLNIASIKSNWDLLTASLTGCLGLVDVLILTDISVPSIHNEINFYNLSNFSKEMSLRERQKGGGILVFIHDQLKYTVVSKI